MGGSLIFCTVSIRDKLILRLLREPRLEGLVELEELEGPEE